MTPDALATELSLNFTGAADLSAQLLPAMRGREGAAMVFVASINALAHFGNPAYSAAKAALLAWMRSIAVEEGRQASAPTPSPQARSWTPLLSL